MQEEESIDPTPLAVVNMSFDFYYFDILRIILKSFKNRWDRKGEAVCCPDQGPLSY